MAKVKEGHGGKKFSGMVKGVFLKGTLASFDSDTLNLVLAEHPTLAPFIDADEVKPATTPAAQAATATPQAATK